MAESTNGQVQDSKWPDITKVQDLKASETNATIQGYLHVMGYDTGPIDSRRGDVTNGALEKFLKDNDIDPKTPVEVVLDGLRAVYESDYEAQVKAAGIIKQGENGAPRDVRAVQAVINDQARQDLKIDGVTGPLTKEAFQKMEDGTPLVRLSTDFVQAVNPYDMTPQQAKELTVPAAEKYNIGDKGTLTQSTFNSAANGTTEATPPVVQAPAEPVLPVVVTRPPAISGP